MAEQKVWGPVPGRVALVHDGDTVCLDLDLGWGEVLSGLDLDGKPRSWARIMGVNAPELNTEAGKAARAFVQQLLPVGTRVSVTSYGWDKYGGRYDAAVVLPSGESLADLLLRAGHAVAVTY